MRYPAWQQWKWESGLLPEAVLAERLILWLPGCDAQQVPLWERIDSVPGAEIIEQDGLCVTAATRLTARARREGFFSKWFSGSRPHAANPSWVLPDGEAVEQLGPRRTDLLLVWAADGSPLSLSHLQERWPAAEFFRKLSDHLYAVTGVQPPQTSAPSVTPTASLPEESPPPSADAPSIRSPRPLASTPPVENPSRELPQESARSLAEKQLAAAQQAGDRLREATALTDLGVLDQRQGEPHRALPRFEQALALARELGLQSLETDILGNLGLAYLDIGQSGPAFATLRQALERAQAAENLYEEKMALDNLGILYGRLRDHKQAIAVYERAQHLAGDLGDLVHRADLLWALAIQQAELGQRELALDRAQQALDLFQQLGNPHLPQLQAALQEFRQQGTSSAAADGNAASGSHSLSGVYLGSGTGGTMQPMPSVSPGGSKAGPGLLRMALTAAHSFAKFVAAGFQTVNVSTYERRLQTCGHCEHHTGTRCLLCGCFTSVKARLPHEKCPIAKWDRE